MKLARETIELLGQIARYFQFEGAKHGLRDREWMALRFLSNANRFSRTPSALATYVGTTRATASYIINELERLGHLEKARSSKDKRSVTLSVTQQGRKLLGRDPITALRDTIAVLDQERKEGLRDALRLAIEQADTTHQNRFADVCKGCIFLREGRAKTGEEPAELTCRFFRASISQAESELLCTNFEQRKH